MELQDPKVATAIREQPEALARQVEQLTERRMRVTDLFDEHYTDIRDAVLARGVYEHKGTGRKLYVQTRPIEGVDPAEDREIVAIAAVSRDPGLTQDYIDTIQDYTPLTGGGDRARLIKQYWRIYEQDGLVNNAVNKYAAILSSGGRYVVRKAKKGKQQKAKESAEAILDYLNRNVNAPKEHGIATASRGLKALTEQGIRVALVEGDFMAREVWDTHQLPGQTGSVALPLTIQTLSMEHMEPLKALGGLGEFWYWKPPEDLRKLIKGEVKDLPKEAKAILKTLFESEIAKQIKKADKALLNPKLLLHVKHRSSDRSLYGESYLEPAKLGIRYLHAVTKTDMVSMESVINRLLVVMVGSSDPTSPYSKIDVAAARAALMQSFFEEPGPNMTIVWQGDDVKVEHVGAMDDVLDINERHKIGERKVIVALGIPAALLDGTASDGKAAGWASLIAASAMAEHLGSAFARTWTELGMRVLEENGFVDLDIEYVYDRSNLVDKVEERNQNRADYIAGGLSIRSWVAAMGRDPDAEYLQRCFEKGLTPGTATWEEAFTPPQGLAGQGEGGIQGQGPGKTPGDGRTPDDETGKPKPSAPAEKKTPAETK